MTEVRFADVFRTPHWPPLAAVVAHDGTATVWASRSGARAWYAVVAEDGADEAVHVAWARPRGQPASYSCALCGTGCRRIHCAHVWAATVAAELIEKENTHA